LSENYVHQTQHT